METLLHKRIPFNVFLNFIHCVHTIQVRMLFLSWGLWSSDSECLHLPVACSTLGKKEDSAPQSDPLRGDGEAGTKRRSMEGDDGSDNSAKKQKLSISLSKKTSSKTSVGSQPAKNTTKLALTKSPIAMKLGSKMVSCLQSPLNNQSYFVVLFLLVAEQQQKSSCQALNIHGKVIICPGLCEHIIAVVWSCP